MGLLFMDGFDAGDLPLRWRTSGTHGTTAGGRFGTGRYATATSSALSYDLPSAKSKIITGFALGSSTMGVGGVGGAALYIYGDSRTVTHLTVFLQQDGVQLRRGNALGTIIGTYSGLFLANTFYYFEVSATISDTVGTCEIRLNGVTIISYSGDTKNGGSATTIDGIAFTTNANSLRLDDFWLLDDSGPAPLNAFLGDVRVVTTVPSGAGNSTQFTPSSGANYTTVDELPYSAADYVSGFTSGTKDTYQIADLPITPTNIYGAQLNIIAKKTDAGSASVRPVVRSGGTDYPGSSTALGSTDANIREIYATDPSTSTAWTISGVNNLEAGMEIV